jgi:DNA polymerase III sliding clamp (beta) subunit (PCNA family)
MIDNLKFVKGVVKKKKLTPILSHFRIAEQRITGSNGDLTLSAPFDSDIEAQPSAAKFVAAINACKGEVDVSLTPAGRLKLSSNSFKAFVDCSTGEFPNYFPEGEVRPVEPGFLDVLQVLKPFIGKDATRPWCNGVLVEGNKLTVTNNIVCVQYKAELDYTTSRMNIPATLIAELLRINEQPLTYQYTERSITFHYEGERWVRSALLSVEWPDIDRLIAKAPCDDMQPLTEDMFADAGELLPFADESRRLFMSPRFLGTHADPEEGARILKDRDIAPSILNIDEFIKLENIVHEIDLTPWPRASFFTGKNLCGVIIGMTYNG